MAHKSLAAVLAAAAVLLLLVAAPTSASSMCSFYKTCADCACSTASYDAADECKTGCAWVPSTGSCVTAQQANESGITAYTSLFPGGDPGTGSSATSDRDSMISEGLVTCPLEYGEGTVVSVALMLLLTVAFMAGSSYHSCTFRKRQSTPLPTDTAWLVALLLAHLPPTDTLQWRGVATKPATLATAAKEEDLGGLMCSLSLVGMGVPSFVWLCIGLPYSVQHDWEFAFFYPIYFVGGLAFLGVGTWLLATSATTTKPTLRSAYALTDKHAVVVTADMKTKQLGTHGSIKSYNVPQVTTVAVQGNNTVVFGAGASVGANATACSRDSIVFADLEDTAPLYRLLLARTPDGSLQATKVGPADTEPPSGNVTVIRAGTLAPATDQLRRNDGDLGTARTSSSSSVMVHVAPSSSHAGGL